MPKGFEHLLTAIYQALRLVSLDHTDEVGPLALKTGDINQGILTYEGILSPLMVN